jgi:hypothetical protein
VISSTCRFRNEIVFEVMLRIITAAGPDKRIGQESGAGPTGPVKIRRSPITGLVLWAGLV